MGWEQLSPAIQSAFDTYWGRKEGQEGRAHEKEMRGRELAHDELMRKLDRAQKKFIADRTAELTSQGMAEEEARRKSELEADQITEANKITQRQEEVKGAELSQTMGDIFTKSERQQTQLYETERTGIEQARLDRQNQLDRESLERRTAMTAADKGKEFSPGDLAEAITAKADEAVALFKAGWEDFSRVFPRLISKDTYDSLKQVGKDKEIADYLTTEIAKQYIQMYATEAEEAGYNLPKEFHYLLDIDDKYMESIQATFDEEMSKAKQKKATRKEKTTAQAKKWGEWRTGPPPLNAPLRSKFPRAHAGYDKFLEMFRKLP